MVNRRHPAYMRRMMKAINMQTPTPTRIMTNFFDFSFSFLRRAASRFDFFLRLVAMQLPLIQKGTISRRRFYLQVTSAT